MQRLAFGVASQGLNSLSNLLLAIMVAREVTPKALGGWSISYALFLLVLALSRALVSTPVLISSGDASADDGNAWRDRATSASVALAAGAAIIMSGVAFVLPAEVGLPLAVTAIGLPWLLMHDSLRYVAFRRGRADQAAALDLAWLLVQLLSFGLLFSIESEPNAGSLVAAWAAGAVVVATVVGLRSRTRISVRRAVEFVQRHRRTSARLLYESAITAGTTALLPIGIGIVLGLDQAGIFRAGQTLMGVVGVFVLGIAPLATVEVATFRKRGLSINSFLRLWSAGVFVVSAAYGLALFSLQPGWGEELLGESWAGVRALLVLFVLQAAVRGPYTALPILLRGARQLDLLIRYRLVTSAPTLLIPLGFGLFGGLEAVMYGVLIATLVTNVQALRHSRRVVLP